MQNCADSISLVCVTNDTTVYGTNFGESHVVRSGDYEVLPVKGAESASIGCNKGLAQATGRVVVFAHQDVYLPRGWDARLRAAIAQLEDQPWAIIGIVGMDVHDCLVGRCWSTGLRREVAGLQPMPCPVVSVDELVIVLNRESGIRFDEALPGFHLYGTDIVQTALVAGLECYVIDAPVIHNSLPLLRIGPDYVAAYRYMQHKWAERLPIATTIVPITLRGWPLLRHRLRTVFRKRRRESFSRLANPVAKARDLGYE